MNLPSYGQLLSTTWKHYVSRFDVVLASNLVIALPIHIALTLISPQPIKIADSTTFVEAVDQIVFDPSIWFLVVMNMVSNLIIILVEVVLVALLFSMFKGQETKWTALWKIATRCYPAALVIGVVAIAATFLGLVLFIVPGVVVAVLFSLALPALVWENLKPIAALKRSVQIVRTRFWRIAGVVLLTQFWLGLLVWIFIGALPNTMPFTIFGLTVASIISSFQTIFHVVLYTACVVKANQIERPTATPST